MLWQRFPSDVNADKQGAREEVINVSLLFSTQQKHTEVERTSKWLKMLKSWDKYKNSDKVSFCFSARQHTSSSIFPLSLLSFTWRLNEKLYKQKQMETRSTKQRGKNCIQQSRAEYKTRSCKTIKPSAESPLSRSNLEMMKGQRKKFEPWAELWMTQWRRPISEIHPTSEQEFSAFSGQILFFFYYYFHLKINWGENVLLIFWGV